MHKFFLFFTLSVSLFAQTYEEFLREQNQAFTTYKEERDKAFSEFLSKEWKAYKASQGLSGYEEDKPQKLPEAQPTKPVVVKKPVPVKKAEPVKKEQVYKKIVIPSESDKYKSLYLSFYGVELKVHYDPAMRVDSLGSVNQDGISQAWEDLAKSDYEKTLSEIKQISDKLVLNDWARYLLVDAIATGICKQANEAKLLSWFLLLKLDYDARVAYQQHRVVLLLPVKGQMFNTVYYTLNQRRYYAIDYYAKGNLGRIKTYENPYEGADKAIGFSVIKAPRFASKEVTKAFHFPYQGENKTVKMAYNEHLMNFFQSYPQVSYEYYFSSHESEAFERSLMESFSPLVVGKSQSEAVDMLLSFVQHAFAYAVDVKQFNKEKVMFPSETLFYPYSDCEDRAILFSYMTKRLLGVDVVGVKFPNHMATAVALEEKVKGSYVRANAKAYIVADPTYVNASVGMVMPQFKDLKSYEIVSTGGEK